MLLAALFPGVTNTLGGLLYGVLQIRFARAPALGLEPILRSSLPAWSLPLISIAALLPADDPAAISGSPPPLTTCPSTTMLPLKVAVLATVRVPVLSSPAT